MKMFVADQDRLKQVGELLYGAEEILQEVLNDLNANADTLRQGWIGMGSTTFFDLFDSTTVPALRKLIATMNEAGCQFNKLAARVDEAEADIVARARRGSF